MNLLPILDVEIRAILDTPLGTRWSIPEIRYDSSGTIQYQSDPPSNLEDLINGLSVVGLIHQNMSSVAGFLGRVYIYNIGIDTESRPRRL